MNFEFFNNLVKFLGKKFYYACAFFLIVIPYNEILKQFFKDNKIYFVVLWLFAIIAFIDFFNVICGFFKKLYLNSEKIKSEQEYFLYALDTIKLNHQNGIKILYFLFNLPVYGNEHHKLISYRDFKNFDIKQQFKEILEKFSLINCNYYNSIFELRSIDSNRVLIFHQKFYYFLKEYFKKNPQEKFDIESII